MVQTLTIDIINSKAMKLLQDLESMKLIRLHNPKSNREAIKSLAKYKGAMTKQAPSNIDNQLNELRNGWE